MFNCLWGHLESIFQFFPFLVYFSIFSPFLSISVLFSTIFLMKSFCFHWIQVCPFISLFLEIYMKCSLIEILSYYATYRKFKALLPTLNLFSFLWWHLSHAICKMLIIFYVCVDNYIMATCVWLVQKDINVVV